MKKLSLVLALAAVIGSTVWFNTHATGEIAKPQPHTENPTIVDKKGVRHDIEVEVAATPVDLEVGLMFRDKMEPDYGMLFELPHVGITRFWMKNTLIPLDMLFIAADGTIKTIHENAEPKSLVSISSEVPVSAVLELNGHRAKVLGITPGDKIEHPYFQNAPK